MTKVSNPVPKIIIILLLTLGAGVILAYYYVTAGGTLPLSGHLYTITAEVQDPLKLALFLTGLRNLIEQTAPGMVTWTTHKYHDQPYVKMSASLAGIAPVPSQGGR